MGNTVDIPENDYNAVKHGYDMVMQNQKAFPTPLVKQIILLGSFTLPKQPRRVKYINSSSDVQIQLSRDQYKSFKKLRDLIHNLTPEQLTKEKPEE